MGMYLVKEKKTTCFSKRCYFLREELRKSCDDSVHGRRVEVAW